ncbi:Transmembrane protein fend-like [Homarus americanus]|uniref:Transmembrane protein fend-like n=1 Tax=Homarus americanus TaxID=6706 RepID=A0A8J5K5I3_HOMAM|nr:Transmembrane protein fend-like [Homarus americanus]
MLVVVVCVLTVMTLPVQCWEGCELLTTNYPIWSITCGQLDKCEEGCEAACAFHSSHPKSVVPLSQHNSRLTLVFSGSAAQWTLSWGRDAPREHVVFALFTRTPGKSWDLRLQTADFGAALDDVPTGSDMKLVAVAESGVLSVIITPYAPPAHPKSIMKPALGLSRSQVSAERPETNGIEVDAVEMWPLLHETEVEESGLVAARVWWAPQSPRGGDYLVTWEVEGGGLKGHLYTDLPEVDLTLWPETVYHVQVELVTGPLGDSLRSAQLTLDTHNITLAAHARQNDITPTLPLVHKAVTPVQLEVVLGVGAGILAALLVVAALVWRRRQSSGLTYDTTTASSAKWGTWNRTLSDLTLDESLVVKNHKLPQDSTNPAFPTPARPPHAPVYTLAPPPHHPSSSLLSLVRPVHTHVNLYSVVPPAPDTRSQVSNI